MNATMMNLARPWLPTRSGRNRWGLACRALLSALCPLAVALATPALVPPAHARDWVDRTPLVRPQALRAAPQGYRQLTIPAAYLSALTARSRTVEFRLTYGGKPATFAVTVTETGRLVNAFVSGALPTSGFTTRSYSGDFWAVLIRRINACKKKYPGNSEAQEKARVNCIDDAIIETIGERFAGGVYEE